MATEAVVGTGSIVGFTPNGYSDNMLTTMDRSEHTRDVINNIERDRLNIALVDTKQELMIARLSRGSGNGNGNGND